MNQTTATFQSSVTHNRWRYFKDRLARYGVGVGGLSVIGAVMLIFVYLFYTVIPLFLPGGVDERPTLNLDIAQPDKVLFLASEEQNEIAVRLLANGELTFFNLRDAKRLLTEHLSLADGEKLRHVAVIKPDKGLFAAVSNYGRLFVLKHEYKVTYPDDVRQIAPSLVFPYGPEPLMLLEQVATEPDAITELAADTLQPATPDLNGLADAVVQAPAPTYKEIPIISLAVADTAAMLAAVIGYADGSITLHRMEKVSSLFSDDAMLESLPVQAIQPDLQPDYLLMDQRMDWIYAASADGQLSLIQTRRGTQAPEIVQRVALVGQGETLTALNLLSGGISLIAGSSTGTLNQWFMVRDDANHETLQRIRSFRALSDAPVTTIVPEYGRRGFLVGDARGNLGVYYSTSGRQLLNTRLGSGDAPQALVVSPRANQMLALNSAGQLQRYDLHNEHPEISFAALWGKVWYESYPEPDYIWQSSSASNDFEPKFSLTPLSFGTLKAAFYAMLFAMPLAIMGAIYTAYFMAPELRRLVKPGIEVMEALPTVILGFLAGLWLAPIVESNLPGIFSLLLLLPFAILLFAFAWTRLPENLRRLVPAGWDAALLVPVLLLFGWLAFAMSEPLEVWLFGGNMPLWLDREMGISYDQRNALVVGLAMGFAVIPTIFSIAEDAIFSVPKHLSNGSLALGATPWQTLVRVVLPTASPGIFSSVMIGMGRAVGETMIVLMATGNTPVMDGSPFQGMRTLSANIAVEMPESEVGSSHYRILFLAGLVLFLFTFFFNTVAELVRQRLREKYSNL